MGMDNLGTKVKKGLTERTFIVKFFAWGMGPKSITLKFLDFALELCNNINTGIVTGIDIESCPKKQEV